MKLKIKKIKLEAGRPVAFLNEKTANDYNLHIGDRVIITQNGKKAVAVIDIVKKLVKETEVSFSKEVFDYLKINYNKEVNLSLLTETNSIRYIAKKLSGKKLSRNEIYTIIEDIVNNSLTEAEIAYFVSSVYEKGMSMKETIALTEAIYKTGAKISWGSNNVADKHCIGGLAGNRTTPIIVSICASAGIMMPKTSSRAITSASGTADTMEVLTKVDISANDLKKIVNKTGACLAWGGSLGLAPADDKIIRVERLLNLDPEPQLIASIMSKKLAAGSKNVLIDIPYGQQAKVSKEEANRLKSKFLKLARHFKLRISVVLTPGDQPIGNGIGPVLEMIDVLNVLKRNNGPKDLENKSIFLAAQIIEMMGKAKSGKGEYIARSILETGAAMEKFYEIIRAQGIKKEDLSLGKYKFDIRANKSGRIAAIKNKWINQLARILGCPEDKRAGIYIHKHKNNEVKKGDILLTFYAESHKKLKSAIDFYNQTDTIIIL